MSKADRPARAGNGKWARDLTFLMAGIGIGTGMALLLAPSTGDDLRYAIGRNYRKAAKHIGRHTDEFRYRAEELLEHAHHLRHLGAKLLNKAA